MSYVAGGVTYDEAGYSIDAFGRRLGARDPNVSTDQPLSAVAASQHTTVDALVRVSRAAATNPAASSKAPVMPSAPRTIVTMQQPSRVSNFPIGLALLAVGAYFFWRHA